MLKSAVAFAPGVTVTFCRLAAVESALLDGHLIISGKQIHGLIFPADGIDHVDHVLVEIVDIHFGRFEFLGCFTVPESEPIPEIIFAPATALLSARI